MNLRISTIILLMFLLFMVGCSKGGISPIVPSNNESTENSITDLRQLSVNQELEENYWSNPLMVENEIWASHFNQNGTLHRAIGPGINASNPLEFVNSHPEIFQVDPMDLVVMKDEIHAGIRYLIYNQTYNGLLVAKSRVDFRYAKSGKLVMIGSDVFPMLDLSTTPAISDSTAYQILVNDVNESVAPELERVELVVYPVPETGALAWRIDAGDWRMYINAIDGSILERIHNEWTYTYYAHTNNNVKMTSPLDTQVQVPGSYTQVEYRSGTGWGSQRYGYGYADIMGDSVFVSTKSSVYEICKFYSPYVDIAKGGLFGSDSSIVKQVTDGNHSTFNWTDNESILSERMVFYHVNRGRDYLKNIDPTNNTLDFRVTANVDQSALCNASAGENTMNFYKSDGVCADTGHVPDVILHEYGHVFTFQQYSQDCPYDMHEGCSDYWGCTITDQPDVGNDIEGAGTNFRSMLNNRRYPATECGGESHCLGEIIAGALWDVRQVVGRQYCDYLFVYSRYGEPLLFQDFPPEMLILDDDNDNPLDGTANYNAIKYGFQEHHGVAVPAPPNPLTHNIAVDLWPAKPPVELNAATGGSFNYNVRLTNLETSSNVTAHVWAEIYVPWLGGYYGPILPPGITIRPPLYIMMTPGQTLQVPLTQLIPGGLPTDTYVYHVKVGTHGGPLMDDAWFDVTLK
jgi:hypothetical protein